MANKRNRVGGKTAPPPDSEQLIDQCLVMHELLKQRTNKLMQLDSNQLCYLLSTQWLRCWKQYVGYWAVTEDGFDGDIKQDKNFGKRLPGRINDDIAAPIHEARDFLTIPKEMEEFQYLNEITSRDKAKEEDFIAVTRDIWQAFLKYYDGVPIRRLIRKQKGSTYYDGEPLRCHVILADLQDPELPQKLQKSSRLTFKNIFTTYMMQLPTLWDLKTLMDFLALYCSLSFQTSQIRVWRSYSCLGTVKASEQLAKSVKQGRYSVKGKQLTFQKYGQMDIDNFIKSSHTLILQVGRQLKSQPPQKELTIGYCEECCGKKQLKISCMCQEVSYCSAKCRTNDQTFHFKTCQSAFDSESDYQFSLLQMQEPPKAGLANLGNSCYINSTIQCLLSLTHIREFLATNAYIKHLGAEETKANNCMFLRKLSKMAKKMIQEKEVAAWPLKGQIDYYLPGFKGYKQHDANDLLVHLLTIINDCLAKPADEAYHPLLKPMIGEFHSKVTCPHCETVSQTDQIFMQVSLPLKPPTKHPLLQYTCRSQLNRSQRGKTKMRDTWGEIRAAIKAKDSIIGYVQEPKGIILVDEENTPPAEAIQGLRGDIFFYQGIRCNPGDTLFTFSLVTTKIICGNKMKAPYGPALPFFINLETTSVGTLWLAIIRYFFPDRSEETYKIEQDYFMKIEEVVRAQSEKPQPEGQDEMESEACQQIVRKYNSVIGEMAKKLGLQVFINHFKKNRNICGICKKRCSGCQLPKIFDEPLTGFLGQFIDDIRFQVYLKQAIEFQIQQGDKGPPEGVTLQDCLQLFNQPEQLDEQNAWYCQKCDVMALAFKQLHVKKFPEILILHLNRFKTVNDKKVKNSQGVSYGEIEEFGGEKYRLVGAVVHEGGMQAGHYWAIARRGQSYYTFNDQQVTKSSTLQHSGAYILIYMRSG